MEFTTDLCHTTSSKRAESLFLSGSHVTKNTNVF